MNQVVSEIIEDIMGAKLTDEKFLEVIRDLPLDPLKALGVEMKEEVMSLRAAMQKHIAKYKETGMPFNPQAFHRLKLKRTIREKQNMMIRHRVNKMEKAA